MTLIEAGERSARCSPHLRLSFPISSVMKRRGGRAFVVRVDLRVLALAGGVGDGEPGHWAVLLTGSLVPWVLCIVVVLIPAATSCSWHSIGV
jgi:hypothetical protein